jgi:hypothetical protein
MMPATPNKLTVDPQGVSVTVDIKDSYGTSITCYTASGGASTHSLPLAISVLTDFFITANGSYTVSIKFAGIEICGEVVPLSGVPHTVKANPLATPAVVAALLADRADIASTPTTYTQTYSTAATTVPAATVSAVATDASTQTTPYGYATQAQADALPVACNALAADVLAIKKVVTQIIDDMQAAGLAL